MGRSLDEFLSSAGTPSPCIGYNAFLPAVGVRSSIGAGEQRGRNREAERFSSLEVEAIAGGIEIVNVRARTTSIPMCAPAPH
jgi:hypothetical protein